MHRGQGVGKLLLAELVRWLAARVPRHNRRIVGHNEASIAVAPLVRLRLVGVEKKWARKFGRCSTRCEDQVV